MPTPSELGYSLNLRLHPFDGYMKATSERSRTVPRPLVVDRVVCSLLLRLPARLLILTEYHTQAW